MGIELTVLGSSGSHTGPGRLCSGYLVRNGDTKVLMEAGNGSTANLQRFVALRDLDAVLVSHRHVDHCADLIGVFYALRFDPAFVPSLPLHAPAEVVETLTDLLSADSAFEFTTVFGHHEVTPGDVVTLGGLTVEFFDSVHPPPTVSMRITDGDGHVLAYSGDSAGGDQLLACARDADLFLCEATWAGDAADHPPGIHLTAREAGELASRAGVGRLVLTHLAGGTERGRVLEEASETYDGPLEIADDLCVYELG